ncbi:MAG: hypothetical protein COU71_01485, partial [Parcubacteria group bacterium CG10_big_fil_rev_8_21_14_0_10_38_31]
LSRFNLKIDWKQVKVVLLSVGVLFAFVTLYTGEMAEKLLTNPHKLEIVEVHAGFAEVATLIFGILAVLYLVGWVDEIYGSVKRPHLLAVIWQILERLEKMVIDTKLRYLFVFIGFISIIVTGALGSAISHGPNADPFVSIIYNLFF